MTTLVESLWSQVRAGRHAAGIGFVPFPLAGAGGLTVVRVSCDDASDAGALEDARIAIRRLLGAEQDIDAPRREASASRTLLEGDEENDVDDAAREIVACCNRLVDSTEDCARRYRPRRRSSRSRPWRRHRRRCRFCARRRRPQRRVTSHAWATPLPRPSATSPPPQPWSSAATSRAPRLWSRKASA
jgi:hypothetical protein